MTTSDNGMETQKAIELILLGVSYLESRVYGDGSVANLMEKTYSPGEIILGLSGLSSSFVLTTAEHHQMLPQEILNNIRIGLVNLTQMNDE